jgi:starch synthase (maltosyl-transferring)
MTSSDGRGRVVIERVQPAMDGGRFAIKRTIGEKVVVEANIFTDGHDLLSAVVLYGPPSESSWHEVPLHHLGNDVWRAEFAVTSVGVWRYTILGWIDQFATWRRDLKKRITAGQNVSVDLLVGAELIEDAVARATPADRGVLWPWVQRLRNDAGSIPLDGLCDDIELGDAMSRCSPRRHATQYELELQINVDRERAGFSAWYELFPRSAATQRGKHGTLRDVEKRLPYVAAMGFDVLYLPPVHPIGRAFRKGRNNAQQAASGDVGSPWGIGASEGGHKSIHPQLGTLQDFRHLVQAAQEHGLEIAMDVAFQCSPDHPYVKDHPQWFRKRPDGSIQYAENPPKKYQDIYPFDFETEDWEALWNELKSIFEFWIEQGVQIFRVDNPHTKPFPFWEWVIGEIRRQTPEVIFLSEAFTRPKIMHRLAKLGFTQSYTYFTWRNTKEELIEYAVELTQGEGREYFRPNFWPNTPDILPEALQVGGRAAFMARLVLAATLSPNYGIYGPTFEHGWCAPREPGSEEYLHSEKYEIHYHDLERPDSLKDFIARVNRIRREHRAFHSLRGLQFHHIDNSKLICYTKTSEDGSQVLLMIVNLDHGHRQSGFVELPLESFGIEHDHPYQLHDLLTDARYVWQGRRNYVELNPHVCPAHIFRIRRRTHSERDFEYYF